MFHIYQQIYTVFTAFTAKNFSKFLYPTVILGPGILAWKAATGEMMLLICWNIAQWNQLYWASHRELLILPKPDGSDGTWLAIPHYFITYTALAYRDKSIFINDTFVLYLWLIALFFPLVFPLLDCRYCQIKTLEGKSKSFYINGKS